jgi:hypothetical protein
MAQEHLQASGSALTATVLGSVWFIITDPLAVHTSPPAQALQWSTQPQTQGSSQTDGTSQHAKKQVTITLPDASHEAAAVAVLAGMYQVQPWPKLLADLTPQQQVNAAVSEDMWQLTAAHQAAMDVLVAAADTAAGLSDVLEGLLSLEAVQDSMLPLLKKALLSKYGNLEPLCPTWEFISKVPLHVALMALPIHAMELLLASDKLKVGAGVYELPAGKFSATHFRAS